MESIVRNRGYRILPDHHIRLHARRGAWWDANKIGLSPPPLQPPDGWLILYHGVWHTPGGYGGADTCLALATAQISDVLAYLLTCPATAPRQRSGMSLFE